MGKMHKTHPYVKICTHKPPKSSQKRLSVQIVLIHPDVQTLVLVLRCWISHLINSAETFLISVFELKPQKLAKRDRATVIAFIFSVNVLLNHA